MVLLPDGQVLVVVNQLAELYDPANGTWRLTGRLNEEHGTASLEGALPLTLLPNGLVLTEGGDGGDAASSVAEVYNPATEIWSVGNSMNSAREIPRATLLASGLVLVAGGGDFPNNSAELYDPVTGGWSYTGSSIDGYAGGPISRLPTGMVLMVGGADAQLYDPATGTWNATGSLHDLHFSASMTLLNNGVVLVAGGAPSSGIPLASAELYDSGIVIATKVSGRGAVAGQGDSATLNLHAKSGDRPTGSVSFSDPAAGISINRAKVRTLTFNGTGADLSGVARLDDGSKVSFSVSAVDNSPDGSSDTFSISLSNGYSAGGTLTSGDIKIQ
jgi:hypothetical protein